MAGGGTYSIHYVYCYEGIIDERIDHAETDYLEHGISKLCLTRLATDLTDQKMAELCVDIVKIWLESFPYLLPEGNETTLTVVSGLKASGIEGKYIETPYWLVILQQQNSRHKKLNNLFENNGYRGADVDIASLIPDDLVQRFVFHFIYDWRSKFKILFQDQEASEGKKLAVLKKQLENVICLYGRRILFGSIWRMYSLPDNNLGQALTEQGGSTVNVKASDGSQLETTVASADPTFPTSQGDGRHGPKPNILDRILYKGVLEHAKAKSLNNLDNWTMVKASFEYKDNNGEERNVQCYAFSGVSPEKTSLPSEWWENSPYSDIDIKGLEILFAKGGEELGQNMVMLIFNALDTFYKEDLRKLTEFVAFGKYSLADAMVEENRNDLVTLDYGEYYDEVIKKVSKCNESILTTIEKLLKEEADASVKGMTTCGHLNQQYSPNMNGLRDIIKDPKLLEKVEKISIANLSKLERELEYLPTKHLDKIRTVLGKACCGEDNVLPLLLAEMLKRTKVFQEIPFLTIRVTFVALDAQHLYGKPFCSTCDKKVRFFSILPSVLHFLGATGSENGKYLEDLFASLQTQARVEKIADHGTIGPRKFFSRKKKGK